VAFVVRLGPLVLDPGRYEIRLTIDDQGREESRRWAEPVAEHA
jgi:hypothetical protein